MGAVEEPWPKVARATAIASVYVQKAMTFMDLSCIMGWKCMCLVMLVRFRHTAGNFRDHKLYGLRDTHGSLLHEN